MLIVMSSRRRGKSAGVAVGYEPVRETKFPMGLQVGAAVGGTEGRREGGERGEDGFAGEIL